MNSPFLLQLVQHLQNTLFRRRMQVFGVTLVDDLDKIHRLPSFVPVLSLSTQNIHNLILSLLPMRNVLVLFMYAGRSSNTAVPCPSTLSPVNIASSSSRIRAM
ncbi:hypothetical protein KCU98_g268, partial [Aureobasidium melanogenum]